MKRKLRVLGPQPADIPGRPRAALAERRAESLGLAAGQVSCPTLTLPLPATAKAVSVSSLEKWEQGMSSGD